MMHIIPLIMFTAASAIATLSFTISYFSTSDKDKKLAVYALSCFIVFSLFGGWLARSLLSPPMILRQITLMPSKINNSDGTYVQMISYTDQFGLSHLVNLNQLFSGTVPDNTLVRVTEYRHDGQAYCGVSYAGMEVLKPHFSIVAR